MACTQQRETETREPKDDSSKNHFPQAALRFAYLQSLEEARAVGMQQGSGWRQGGGSGEGRAGARGASGVGGEVGALLGAEGAFVQRWRQVSHEEREGLVDMAVTLTLIHSFKFSSNFPRLPFHVFSTSGGEGNSKCRSRYQYQETNLKPHTPNIFKLQTLHQIAGTKDL